MTLSKPRRMVSLIAAVIAIGLVSSGCSPRLATRGNLPDPDLLKEIRPGVSSRNDVADLLGTPSSVAMFGDETWYYISERTETQAFFHPEVIERKVVIVSFDQQGMVRDIESRGLESAREIQPVERETPTVGTSMTIMQQLLGNLGRFSGGEEN
jgi:outer membrane protein assembly factor BamE (lipoprotein component of BamABCDE complex)